MHGNDEKPNYGIRNILGIIAGPSVLVFFLLTDPAEGLTTTAWRTAGVALLMATFWITEAIAIPATALIPLVLFPILGISEIGDTASPYAHKLIFLFMGGFFLALAMQRWNLHKRIALHMLKYVGTKPNRIILGFMAATAFMSMWVSNTATTMMLFPVALSVIKLIEQTELPAPDSNSSASNRNFSLCLMLSIAYAANIGGVGTIIGTPPNAFMKGFLADTYGYDLSFSKWMMFGVPFALIMLCITYQILTKYLFRFKSDACIDGVDDLIDKELYSIGGMRRGEVLTAAAGTLMAFFWIFGPYLNIPGLSDTVVAMAGGLLLFIMPVNLLKGEFVLSWKQTKNLPWNVIILFGGGLTLAKAVDNSGLSTYIANMTGELGALPPFLLVLIISCGIIFLTEMTSNTATTTTFLPILGAIAIGINMNPLLLVIPAAVAASCAFMLPVATPPNAVVFSSGRITLPQMAKAGFALNIITMLLVPVLLFTLGKAIF